MKPAIELTQEALALHQKMTKQIETYYRDGGQFSEMKDWGAKYIGQVLRIAGLLHVATYPSSFKDQKISAEILQKAYQVGEFLIPHAQRAYGLVSNNSEIEMAKRVLDWIRKEAQSTFTQNECHSRFKNTLTTADQVSKVLHVLIERNYIREVHRARTTGRPSKSFQVNPQVL